MKDQAKVQITNDQHPQEVSFNADHLQGQHRTVSSSFKNEEGSKRVLPAAMQKKINPRLLIL